MNREALPEQINEWHENDEHKKIVDAIEALPREDWGYELTCLLARAYNNLYGAGDPRLEKAISLLESVREDGKDDALWHFRMGYALFFLEREEDALRYFLRAAELDPSDSDALYFIWACEKSLASKVKADSQPPIPTNEFQAEIVPFLWVDHEDSASVCLNVGEYIQDVFDTRADEGFEGSGYDWESLAQVFLKEKMPELIEKVNFDSEASMFCAYSEDKTALKDFIVGFKTACENKALITDLFSRAELD